MRVGIDYTAAVRQSAGIGRYTRNLVGALIELDDQVQFTLLVAGLGISDVSSAVAQLTTVSNVRLVNLPLTDRQLAVLWHRLRLPLWAELACGSLDVFYSPDFALPPLLRARSVLTVHDLSFMRLPECSESSLRAYLMRAVPKSVRRADVVLADSKSTRNDVIELLGTDPQRVKVVYPGVEARFRPVEDLHVLASVRQRYSLPRRFVLGLGTLQPRKNFRRLIDAYQLCRNTACGDVELVISGREGWLYQPIFERVAELGLEKQVHFTGHVDDGDLPALYSLAELFVFPSLYEGFGLPPLEAMACGTPVVTSSGSSLCEVVGDSALLIDPTDVKGLAQAMSRVMSDQQLRAQLIEQGLRRARRFTWRRAAEELFTILEQLG
jgi:glycosyltransferase involved in cell wall biosynthesis